MLRLVRLEGSEQLPRTRHELGRLGGVGELGAQVLHVAAAHRVDAVRILRRRMARQREEVAHDLRIGLPVEPVALDRPRGARLVDERAVNRPPPGAVGPEEGAVDVEEDELHARKIPGQPREVSGRRTATSMSRNRPAAGVCANRSSDATPPRDSAECTT